MKKIIFILMLLTICSQSMAVNISEDYKRLDKEYESLIASKHFEQSLSVAYQMNKIDPADTQSLLYIVFASVKTKREIPSWVLGNPWPNATPHDRFNRTLAEHLFNSR